MHQCFLVTFFFLNETLVFSQCIFECSRIRWIEWRQCYRQFPARSEAVAQGCTIKMLCWKISQNSQESTCAGVFFNKTTALPCNFIKKETLGQELFRDFYEIFQNAIYRTCASDRSPLWNFASSLALFLNGVCIY